MPSSCEISPYAFSSDLVSMFILSLYLWQDPTILLVNTSINGGINCAIFLPCALKSAYKCAQAMEPALAQRLECSPEALEWIIHPKHCTSYLVLCCIYRLIKALNLVM